MTTTGAALTFGALLTLGLLLIAIGWRTPPRDETHQRRRSRWTGIPARTRRNALLGLAGGAVVWLVSGWALAVVLVPLAVLGLPVLLRAAENRTAIARLEALEEWTRSLAGVLTVGAGLEQALITSARSAPAPIAAEVTTLAARLRARTPTELALRGFADQMNDATADLIVLSLTLAARKRGMGLAGVLQSLAGSVAREVAIRRSVDAERAKLRTTTRSITLLTLIVIGGLFATGTYVAPYRTPIGSLVLSGLIAAYIGTLAWMRHLGAARNPERLITDPPPLAVAP